ncbi:E3 ubiquitin-protein ligase rnf213-beta isoform X2 [Amia ocellicauda]|uniref:E3 ubiquitin-protein ligase rnf213-beta isoform X2 n=1 Tax=Amia ocellicauda TaxID=2972642 RepID=UPI003464C86F
MDPQLKEVSTEGGVKINLETAGNATTTEDNGNPAVEEAVAAQEDTTASKSGTEQPCEQGKTSKRSRKRKKKKTEKADVGGESVKTASGGSESVQRKSEEGSGVGEMGTDTLTGNSKGTQTEDQEDKSEKTKTQAGNRNLRTKNKETQTKQTKHKTQHTQTDPMKENTDVVPEKMEQEQSQADTTTPAQGPEESKLKRTKTEKDTESKDGQSGSEDLGSGVVETLATQQAESASSTEVKQTVKDSVNKSEEAKDGVKSPEKPSDSPAEGSQSQVKGNRKSSPVRSPTGPPMFTIYIYAVLDKKFRFNTKLHQLVLLYSGGYNILQMTHFRGLGLQGYLVEAHVSVEERFLFRGGVMSYQYAVQQTQKQIVEMAERKVNIPTDPQVKELHLYEGFIHHQAYSRLTEWVYSFTRSRDNEILQARQTSSKTLLDRIFQKLETSNKDSIGQFIQHLRHFQMCLQKSDQCVVFPGNFLPSMDVSQVIVERLLQFLQTGPQGPLQKKSSGHNPLVLGFVVFQASIACSLQLGVQGYAAVCRLLSSSPAAQNTENLEELKVLFQNPQCTVINLLNRCAQDALVELPLLLPLLHMLRGPGEAGARTDLGRAVEKWHRAGLEGVNFSTFRERIRCLPDKRRKMLNLMEEHRSQAGVSPLVLHNWLCLVATEDIPEYSKQMGTVLEHVIQNLDYRLQEYEKRTQDNNHVQKDLQATEEVIMYILKKLQEDKERILYSGLLDSVLRLCVSSHRSICKMAILVQRYRVTIVSFQLVQKVAEIQLSFLEKDCEGDCAERTRLTAQLEGVQSEFVQWRGNLLQQPLWSKQRKSLSYPKEIELWDSLLGVECAGQPLSEQWRHNVEEDLRKRLRQASPSDRVAVCCAEQLALASTSSTVQMCFRELCQEAITEVCQTEREGELLAVLSACSKDILPPILSQIILESTARAGGEMVAQLLRQQSAVYFLLSQSGWQELQVVDEARQALGKAQAALASLVKGLYLGSIPVGHLQITLEHKDQFIKLYRQQQNISKQDIFKADVEKMLTQREKDLQVFNQQKEYMDTLIKMVSKISESFKVDELTTLEQQHKADLQSVSLNKLVEVQVYGQAKQTDATRAVQWYSVCDGVRNMAWEMHELRDSTLVLSLWVERANLTASSQTSVIPFPMTLRQVQALIWAPGRLRYLQLGLQILNGSVTFEELDRALQRAGDRGKGMEMQMELELMASLLQRDEHLDSRWPTLRLCQIREYQQLHLAAKSASAVLRTSRELHLTGDFTHINSLTQLGEESFKQRALESLSSDLVEAREQLAGVTEQHAVCLEEFLHCKTLVDWVKDNLKNMSDLKVFVDLASISAGENDSEIDRVACFHDAVMGYSPFLYYLKSSAGFVEFMDCARRVWVALERDEKLPEKLRDSTRWLDWLKGLRETHGSVEQSSLSLATAINMQGVYRVGKPRSQQGKRSLQSLLQVTVKKDNQEKQYTLEELLELQNKLMLISSKGEHGKEQVNRFMQVFESVQRLGGILLQLHSSGNMLFREWEAFITCSPDRQPCVQANFMLPGVAVIQYTGEVTIQLQDLCRSMEMCHQEWCTLVTEMRYKFYTLNYYTAGQIVYLCSQLRDCQTRRLPQQVLALLSFLTPGCTSKDILDAWALTPGLSRKQQRHTLRACEADEVSLEHENQRASQNEGSIEDSTDSESIEFCDYDEVGVELGSDQYQYVDEQVEIKTGMLIDLSQIEEVCMEEGTKENVEGLWRRFKEDMARYLDGHLDIITLAQFLLCLSEKNKQETKRTLSPFLQEGKPNLVLCPESDILSTALGLYVESRNEPLPSSDEMLLCREDTTSEEVEIFLRRSLGWGGPGGTGKIFSLINPGLLAYDVSVTLGEQFEVLQRSSRPQYRLVIVCSVKHQHRYVPSFFSNYKVQAGLGVPTDRARSYLKDHFAVTHQQTRFLDVYPDCISVWTISSTRPAVGKSLYVNRLFQKLQQVSPRAHLLRIRLIEPRIDLDWFVKTLFEKMELLREQDPVILHIDAAAVRSGLEEFLFQVLILGCVTDSEGKLWKRNPAHLLLTELLRPRSTSQNQAQTEQPKQSLLDILPTIHCRPPKEVRELEVLRRNRSSLEPLMDELEFASEGVQRSYQYLKRYNGKQNLDEFKYKKRSTEGNPADCLFYLLANCGMKDPSWAELRNFAWFLNLQLSDCESSIFCDPDFVGKHLLGFKSFIVKFMVLMARDFATPSMEVSDQSPTFPSANSEDNDLLAQLTIRKRWESESHPYIFFNADHMSMSFLGFHVKNCDAVDPQSGRVLMRNVMSYDLLQGIQRQGISLTEDFDSLSRESKIKRLSLVVGAKKGFVEGAFDPDPTYELTTDNVMKMLAIHMRFRCEIPVIIMGETGCGKTRLVRFLCDLQRGGKAAENMKLVKVHGGTTAEMIYRKVKEAEGLAIKNKKEFSLDTVLFFDEANTTESIFAIKEVLCDRTVKGQPLQANTGLKIVAACNPYRKHSPEMIKRLELAGLGYRVKAGETEDRLGAVPLRQLVYRVQPLPPSMVPLVWDFGQLSDTTELSYTRQIVLRQVMDHVLPLDCIDIISSVLAVSQRYMRSRKNECSFVSLRDVERSMRVLVWFYQHSSLVFLNSDSLNNSLRTVKCLALAVGVCYYPSLVSKLQYLTSICRYFPKPLDSAAAIEKEISSCQDVFLHNIKTRETVAKNAALKENVFLMVVCIELRIPLFLVGKPGSSKSLAKTVVADAMQGQASHCSLFKQLKQVHMVSFQCSPHSSPEGIIGTFWQCARFQQGKSMDEYVSVVVLDEIGLAEDSPQMPLKTLHPLLEDGCIDKDRPDPHMKVGFVGISNWALDPAKMNRGIFVSRWDPSENELVETAKGICSSDNSILLKIQHLFLKLAKAFLNICKDRESNQFFGLRDYYSLVKMIFAAVKASQKEPSESQLAEAILRNFSGRPEDFDPLNYFKDLFQNPQTVPRPNTLQMVENNLDHNSQEESRYLLLLTTNNAALHILQQRVFSKGDQRPPEIVFGSGFPKDQEYAQVCRNVNRVKTCMETGRTVVLLNLQNLYESLYDALNQYYVYLGGQQYVDLGLGTHRVKCRVHRDFRLIVVEDQYKVYKQFPVPLINRLEKHRVDRSADLTPMQQRVLKKIKKWIQDFISMAGAGVEFEPSDAFIGFHGDACSSALLQALEFRNQCKDREARNKQQSQNIGEQVEQAHFEGEVREGGSQKKGGEADGPIEDTKLEALEQIPDDSGSQGKDERDKPMEEVNNDGHVVEGEGKSDMAMGSDEHQVEETVGEHGREMEDGENIRDSVEVEEDEVLETAKYFLLNCATPDAVLRLKYSNLEALETGELQRIYFHQQHHLSLRDFMEDHLSKTEESSKFIEVTTFSSLLTQSDVRAMAQALDLGISRLLLLSLHQFDTESSFCTKIRIFLRDSGPGPQVLIIQTDIEESLHSEELIASAKYCTMNEMSSMEPSQNLCYVVFITKLSRITGGSQYSGFQGGMWLSVHIDDLRDTEEMSSNLSSLCGTTISELFARSIQPEETGTPADSRFEAQKKDVPCLDCVSLLRSCVQRAVGLLRDTNTRTTRSMERVQILLSLMGEKPGTPGVRFVQALLSRLTQALAVKEELVPSPGEWVNKESKKRQALQEGGTLRHTLWRHLQATVTPVLARMLGELDRDANLDLLYSELLGGGLTRLWLDIVEDTQILDLMLPQNSGGADKEIPVECNLQLGGQERKTAAPFSWLVNRQCQSLWEESQYVQGSGEDSRRRVLQFISSFASSRLGIYFKKLSKEERVELGKLYLKDFLLLSFTISSEAALEVFTRAVLCGVSELQCDTTATADLSPAWILAVFRHYGPRLHNLSHTLQLQPRILSTLGDTLDMRQDVLALGMCVEAVERCAVKTLPDCRSFLHRMELLQPCVERACGESYSALCSPGCLEQLTAIRAVWRGVLVVAIFIQQVVLRVKELDPRLEALALQHCALLHKFMQGSSDLSDSDTLKGLMRILHSCNEKSSHLDFRFGINKCTVCLLDLTEPTILPCKHVFCLPCLNQSIEGGRLFCPNCRVGLSPDFRPAPSDTLKSGLQKHRELRKHCNAFFLEVVSRFCLAEGVSPGEGVVGLLFSLLISAQGAVYRTRELSPFLECVDRSPVVRSVLPKLLLNHSFEQVKGHIQEYLKNLEQNVLDKEDLSQLYLLFVNCFQDALYCPGKEEGRVQEGQLQADTRFLSRVARRQTPSCQDDPAEFLQTMAGLQACLDTAANVLRKVLSESELQLAGPYLTQVKAVCEYSRNDWYRIYLLRAVNRLAGMDRVQALLRDAHWHWVFPPEVITLQRQVPAVMDRFLCVGPVYKALRDEVSRAVLESQAEPIATALQGLGCPPRTAYVLLCLTLFRQVTCHYALPDARLHPRPQDMQPLEIFLRGSSLCSSRELKEFCCGLLTNRLGVSGFSLSITPTLPSPHRTLLELVVHASAVFLTGNALLSPLHQISCRPQTMTNCFLPTMPDDHTMEARSWMRNEKLQMYVCANGHVSFVGECGRPVAVGRCPDCGVCVGGSNHNPVPGFTKTQSVTDTTRTGHVLGEARQRSDAPERQLSLAASCTLRLLTHMAMLLGASCDPRVMECYISCDLRPSQHRELFNRMGKTSLILYVLSLICDYLNLHNVRIIYV